jgi:hypothetical protein
MDDDRPFRGTGPRLITTREASLILGVNEDAILAWIRTGQMRAVTLASGEYRLRLIDEQHSDTDGEDSGYSFRSGIYVHDFWPDDMTDAEMLRWQRELKLRRREKRLEGVDLSGIDVNALAEELAARVGTTVPRAWTVSAIDGIIMLDDPDGVSIGEIDLATSLGGRDQSGPDRILGVVLNTLDRLQTDVAEETAEPWPGRVRKPYSGLAMPGGEVVGDEVRFWFGPAAAPIVTYDPVRLAGILTD